MSDELIIKGGKFDGELISRYALLENLDSKGTAHLKIIWKDENGLSGYDATLRPRIAVDEDGHEIWDDIGA